MQKTSFEKSAFKRSATRSLSFNCSASDLLLVLAARKFLFFILSPFRPGVIHFATCVLYNVQMLTVRTTHIVDGLRTFRRTHWQSNFIILKYQMNVGNFIAIFSASFNREMQISKGIPTDILYFLWCLKVFMQKLHFLILFSGRVF